MTIGGLNAATFYLTSYRRVFGLDAPLDAPRHAKVIAAISLCAWIGVITGGRLLTFYPSAPCEGPQTHLLLTAHRNAAQHPRINSRLDCFPDTIGVTLSNELDTLKRARE